MLELPKSVLPLLIAAGWVPGRRATVEQGIPSDHPAVAILAEFGGLHVRTKSDNRSDVVFEYHDITKDPLFTLWQELLKTRLIYVGQSADGYEYFLVDHSGRWFQASVMNCAIEFVGYAFAEAVERILLIGMQDLNCHRPRSGRPTPVPPTANDLSARVSPTLAVPLSVHPLFTAAGWKPERRVLVYRGVPPDHPAAAILASLGNLHIGTTGAGLDRARSDIEFVWDDIEDDQQLGHWQGLLGTEFVSIGHYQRRYCQLLVDGKGRCFSSNIVSAGFDFEGHTFAEAIERILLGQLPFDRSSRAARLDMGSAARRNRPAGPI